MKSLKIICTLYRAKTWDTSQIKSVPVTKRPKQSSGAVTPVVTSRIPEVSNDSNENVALEISDYFLYIISSFGSFSLKDDLKNTATHAHFLRMLKSMINLIPSTDLPKFITKLIFESERALASNNSLCKLIAVQISYDLIDKLPSSIVIDNLASLVVNLFPILNYNENNQFDKESFLNVSDDFLEFDKIKLNLFEAKYLVLADSKNIPKVSRSFLTVLFRNDMFTNFLKEAKILSINLLHKIFINGDTDLKASIIKIPSFPNISELHEINQLHSSKINEISSVDNIKHLCSLLNHDSNEVKLVSLRNLHNICKLKSLEFYSMMAASAAATAGSALSNSVDENNILYQLIVHLMEVVANTKHPGVLELCSLCLGEIGALDPTKLAFVLPTSRNLRSDGDNFLINNSRSYIIHFFVLFCFVLFCFCFCFVF